MYKIGIVGDRDSVLGFMALGFSVHEAQDVEDAGRILREIVKDESYAIIYITENYAAELEDVIAKFKDQPLPAIITIPGRTGNTGYGMKNVKDSVVRAIGADILFKD